MAPPGQEARRPERRTRKRGSASSARLEELRHTAEQIIERTLGQRFPLSRPDTAAEAERLRQLYAPLFIDLLQRTRAAVSLEELDEVMSRHTRLADLLAAEVEYLRAREQQG